MSSMRVLVAALAVLILSITFQPAAVAAEEAGPPADLVLILDASGSMWGQIEGENKIVIARRVLGELIDELPDDGGEIGLVAYGHRREGDCADIETVAALGPLDRDGLKGTVNALNPKGKTPITASVEQAFGLLQNRGRGATVILVSDGLETCGGDPCAAVRVAKDAGADFVMHVVGFDVADEDVSSLECAAQVGGGLFLSAENAAGLSEALDTAVERSVTEIPEGRLSVKVTADGELQDASVSVVDSGTGEGVGGGRTYANESTNPRIVPLPDGEFDVLVEAVGLRGDVERRFSIEIADGSTVEKEFDYSSGELSVSVLRNGERSDASYDVMVAGTTDSVAGGRTYTGENHNPAKKRLTPGTYDVEIRSVELAGEHRHRWEGVEVPSQGSASLEHEWTSGTLQVGAVGADGERVDATLSIRSADGESVAGGRTYTGESSNPKTFLVVPGDYTVTVEKIRGPKKELAVTVGEGETVRLMVDFSGE